MEFGGGVLREIGEGIAEKEVCSFGGCLTITVGAGLQQKASGGNTYLAWNQDLYPSQNSLSLSGLHFEYLLKKKKKVSLAGTANGFLLPNNSSQFRVAEATSGLSRKNHN